MMVRALIPVPARLVESEDELPCGIYVGAEKRALHLPHVMHRRILIYPGHGRPRLHPDALGREAVVLHLHSHRLITQAHHLGLSVGVRPAAATTTAACQN